MKTVVLRKTILSIIVIVASLTLLSACIDYGYTFHYSVTGGNGTLKPTRGGDTSPVTLRGGRKGQQLKFIATPDEGYRVKQWTFNGEVVEGNKTEVFVAQAKNRNQPNVTVTVEFEPVNTD